MSHTRTDYFRFLFPELLVVQFFSFRCRGEERRCFDVVESCGFGRYDFPSRPGAILKSNRFTFVILFSEDNLITPTRISCIALVVQGGGAQRGLFIDRKPP